MKFILSHCLLVFTVLSFSQNQTEMTRYKRDSLRSVFSNSSNADSAIVEAYKKIAISYRGDNQDSLFLYLEKLKDYSEKNTSYNGFYEYYFLKARVYKKSNPGFSFDTVEIYLNKAIENAKKLDSESVLKQVNTYYDLSYDFLKYRKLDKAFLYANKANDLALKNNDIRAIEKSSMIMGAYHFYGSMKYDTSLHYLNKADSLFSKYHKNHPDLGTTYSLKGSVLMSIENTKEALEYFYKAKQIFEIERQKTGEK